MDRDIKIRVIPQSATGEPVKPDGGQLGDERPPLVDSGVTDAEEVGDCDNGIPPRAVVVEDGLSIHENTLQHTVTSGVKGALSDTDYNASLEGNPAEGIVAIGKIIRDRRKARGWSQRELAARVGITIAGISEIERGITKSLKGPTLEGLARALDIPPAVLAGRRNPTSVSSVYSPDQLSISNRVEIKGTVTVTQNGDWTAVDALEGSLDFPSDDPRAYALRIVGDSLHPRIKSGEYIVLEPSHVITPGDEVMITLHDGRSKLRELAWHRDGQIALNGLVENHARSTLPETVVKLMHFIAAIVKPSRFRPE